MKKLFVVLMVLPALVIMVQAADFNGDGTGEIAIFRESSGLWAIRGVTRVYFGSSDDNVVPGDYDGNGTDALAIFRPASGLWAARGVTRVYFGGVSDEAKPGDYNGDGTFDVGIFRGSSGLWAVRDVTRIYYGRSTDLAIAPGTVKAPTRTINVSSTAQAAGYYAAFDLATVEPVLSSSNIRSGVTVFGVAGDTNVVNTSSGTAAASDIKSGQVAWVDGNEVTGTIPTQTVSNATVSQSAGYYSAFDLSTVDTDLAAANIKSGVVIYGVNGSYLGGGSLPVTGQTTSYADYDDGYYEMGSAFNYQTSDPAANGDIVTTDNVTGLIWASDGNEAGCNWGQQTNWNAAIDWCSNLDFAGYDDWRLPNVKELQSIIDYGTISPAIDTTYFINTKSDFYWSSTTVDDDISVAWYVSFYNGYVYGNNKTSNFDYVRAVRGGE